MIDSNNDTLNVIISGADYIKQIRDFQHKHGFENEYQALNKIIEIMLAIDKNSSSRLEFMENGDINMYFKNTETNSIFLHRFSKKA